MHLLDREQSYVLDASNMEAEIYRIPDQLEQTYQNVVLKSKPEITPELIVIGGVGGSAIGGDVLRNYLQDKINVPVIVQRGYTLSKYVGPKSLVILVSYSGNTEETLQAYQVARQQQASIIAITHGGKLREKALIDGVGLVEVPSGLCPRASLGILFAALLKSLKEMGIYCAEDDLQRVIELLNKERLLFVKASPFKDNIAKQLAHEIYLSLPLIWGTENETDMVARRFKAQLNENAKMYAVANSFPELNHNEIMAFEADSFRNYSLLVLETGDEPAALQRQLTQCLHLVHDKLPAIHQVIAKGNSRLEKLFYLIMLTDYISFYAAILRGVDPTPIGLINQLKERMSSCVAS